MAQGREGVAEKERKCEANEFHHLPPALPCPFLFLLPFLFRLPFQLDLGSRKKVIGVMLYSGGDVNRRVPKFAVRSSEDGREWNFFLDGYGNKMVSEGKARRAERGLDGPGILIPVGNFVLLNVQGGP